MRGRAYVRSRKAGGGGVVEGRVALVTGGGRGIGRAIAVKLAEEGARVAVSYRSNDSAAAETAELVRDA
ncbi:MAG TPA: SDR family NAD(P)-dependent oxidoreductase, partial [Rubrobacteraceae bacterium]|nr:SDR family NAD(P)-dependent oxidoreductase [Rubrobacteraceae bacterium]